MANTKKKYKLKKGDQVFVLSGKDKGKTGEITKVLSEKDRMMVSGVNIAKHHERATQFSAGGIVEKEKSIHISNLALVDPKENKPTRVGFKRLEDGSKVRVAKRSGEVVAQG